MIQQVIDIITTNRARDLGGEEVNPLVGWFMDYFGEYWWIAKLIMVLIGGLVIAYIGGPVMIGILVALNILYLVIIINNMRMLWIFRSRK